MFVVAHVKPFSVRPLCNSALRRERNQTAAKKTSKACRGEEAKRDDILSESLNPFVIFDRVSTILQKLVTSFLLETRTGVEVKNVSSNKFHFHMKKTTDSDQFFAPNRPRRVRNSPSFFLVFKHFNLKKKKSSTL